MGVGGVCLPVSQWFDCAKPLAYHSERRILRGSGRLNARNRRRSLTLAHPHCGDHRAGGEGARRQERERVYLAVGGYWGRRIVVAKVRRARNRSAGSQSQGEEERLLLLLPSEKTVAQGWLRLWGKRRRRAKTAALALRTPGGGRDRTTTHTTRQKRRNDDDDEREKDALRARLNGAFQRPPAPPKSCSADARARSRKIRTTS